MKTVIWYVWLHCNCKWCIAEYQQPSHPSIGKGGYGIIDIITQTVIPIKTEFMEDSYCLLYVVLSIMIDFRENALVSILQELGQIV